jgi:hypothetical protein
MKSVIRFVAATCAGAAVIGIVSGAAYAASKTPTKAAVIAAINNIDLDRRDIAMAGTLADLPAIGVACKSMKGQVSQVQSMKRPKNVSKQAWTYVKQAMAEDQSGAEICVTAADTDNSQPKRPRRNASSLADRTLGRYLIHNVHGDTPKPRRSDAARATSIWSVAEQSGEESRARRTQLVPIQDLAGLRTR